MIVETSVEQVPVAWQPLTPRGVAAFARASLGRLLLVQCVIALLAAGAAVWFLQTAWFPVVSEAIGRLPDHGAIRLGRLDWHGNSPETLADDRFLALTVDLDHSGAARSPAHIQVEFGRDDFQVFSLFGFMRGVYPAGRAVAFNRLQLEPWWGAWAPVILALTGGGAVVGLLLVWSLLASVYWLPAKLAGFLANRDLGWGGSWRLAGAALMPGALVMTAAIGLYGMGALDLVGLLAVAVAHVAVGWICLGVGVACLPRKAAVVEVRANPFAKSET